MEALNNYKKAELEVYKHFGFEGIPEHMAIEDNRDFFWAIPKIGTVFYGDTAEIVGDRLNEDCFEDDFHENTMYESPLWETADYTAIIIDRFDAPVLTIFDNSKKIS